MFQLRHASLLATMDTQRREITDGAVFARDGVIEAVGPTAALPATAEMVVDASDHVVIPGLVNIHPHMFQTLTRALRPAQDAALFDWRRALVPVWARLTPKMVVTTTQLAMAELLLSGCTITSDHKRPSAPLPERLPAGRQPGSRTPGGHALPRFHAARGAMSVGQSAGGLPPRTDARRRAAGPQFRAQFWH